MVESTCFQHTSSHPDKYNNSINRTISKEEEREDPRRDTSIFEYSGVSTFYKEIQHSYKELHAIQQVFQSSRAKKTILHIELILLHEVFKKHYNYKAHPVQASSSNCSLCLQAFYTAESSHKAPTAQAGFQLILPGRNSILSGSQHPRTPYSSSQAHSYRILPGEKGFFPKGLSIVCPCNTKVSVFQNTY